MSLHSPRSFGAGAGNDDLPATVTLWWIARELGVRDFKIQRLITYVTLLTDQAGFPPPLPISLKKRLETKITGESRWRRVAVEHWLDGFLPPDCAAALDDAAKAAAGEAMDAAAQNLKLVASR